MDGGTAYGREGEMEVGKSNRREGRQEATQAGRDGAREGVGRKCG